MAIVGVVCGAVLYCIWCVAIMAVLFTFFAEPNAMGVFIVTFPIMIRTWLLAGPLPFFILFGHYLFSHEEMTGTELLRDRSGLAASASGFLLWLAVLAVLEVSGVAVGIPILLPGVTLSSSSCSCASEKPGAEDNSREDSSASSIYSGPTASTHAAPLREYQGGLAVALRLRRYCLRLCPAPAARPPVPAGSGDRCSDIGYPRGCVFCLVPSSPREGHHFPLFAKTRGRVERSDRIHK